MIVEFEFKFIVKCFFGYCVCINKIKYGCYCVIMFGYFNGVFSFYVIEDISGIDFWWIKEIVCSFFLLMIKRLVR